MEFHVKETMGSFDRELILEYTDLQNQRKCISRNIPTPYLHSGVMDYYDYVKKSMMREVKEELADQAMQISSQLSERRNMVITDYTTDYPVEMRGNPMHYQYSTDSSYTCYPFNVTSATAGTQPLTYDDLYRTWSEVKTWEEEISIEVPFGKRTITVTKKYQSGQKVIVTEQDINEAFKKLIENAKFNIVTHRAERRAEDLLRSFISEIDFRNYKEKGYFLVKSGNRLFKIYKDKNRWCDMWEEDSEGFFIPKNRLCTHTQTRDLPEADEALSKLLLARSNRLIDHSNLHPIDTSSAYYVGEQMNRLKAKELILN